MIESKQWRHQQQKQLRSDVFVQRSTYVMAAQNTTTPKMQESGTIHWLCGVGWYGIPVIYYVEAVIILLGEYFFCMQLTKCFSNVLRILYRNFSVLFTIADF